MKKNREEIFNYLKNENNLKQFINKTCEDLNSNTILFDQIQGIILDDKQYYERDNENRTAFSKLDSAAQFLYLLDFQLSLLHEKLNDFRDSIDSESASPVSSETIH